MATATYSVTTSSSGLPELWRKVQAGIVVAANFGVEEWNALQKAKKLDIDWSAREITRELDIKADYGTASISEGGKEARPSTPSAVTATLTWILLNKRFTISKTAQYIAEHTPKAMLENQLKYQGKKALQGIRRKVGDMFWGFSTGIFCHVASTSGDDIVVDNMYGVTSLGGTSANRRCADFFEVGDVVAILNPTGPALRTGGIQAVTAVTRGTNTLGVSAGSITGEADGDYVVFANNLENTTLAGGCEYNKALVGILDGMTSTSVHSVSGATYTKWTASYADTGGGRFTGVKLHKMKQAIANEGGGEMDTLWWANGVENDVLDQLQAGLRFNNAFALEMDGKPVSKGVTIHTSKRVPDGYVFGFDSSNSVERMTLLPEPGTPAFADGDKLQDDSGLVFSLDYPCAIIYANRANMGYASSVTQL